MNYSKIKNLSKNILKISVTILIIIFLIYKIGLNNLISTLSSANILILLVIIPIKLISLLFTTLNIKILLDVIKKKITFYKLFIYSNLAWSIGLFLPGRLGEFSLSHFLQEEDYTLGESAAVSLLDKISTFIVLGILSILAILKYFDTIYALQFSLILLTILIISLFLLSNEKIRNIIKQKILGKYSLLFYGFYTSFKDILINHKKIFILNLLTTLIKWSFSFLTIKIIFISLGTPTHFLDISYITSLSMIIALIPISIGGIGLRESTAVYLFNIVYIKPEITLAAHLINIALNYIIAFIFITFNWDLIKINKEKYSSKK
ncbi:flippase-like domain-containing protein [Candidatus Woesearchaeota archaeon]|nr:flippase-like domain-containing protein [Candidatus Woesearchaeota archaeon]